MEYKTRPTPTTPSEGVAKIWYSDARKKYIISDFNEQTQRYTLKEEEVKLSPIQATYKKSNFWSKLKIFLKSLW